MEFVDEGHDLLLAVGTGVSEELRELSQELGVDLAAKDTAVIDHFNYDGRLGAQDHTVVITSGVSDNKAVFSSPVTVRGQAGGGRRQAGAFMGKCVGSRRGRLGCRGTCRAAAGRQAGSLASAQRAPNLAGATAVLWCCCCVACAAWGDWYQVVSCMLCCLCVQVPVLFHGLGLSLSKDTELVSTCSTLCLFFLSQALFPQIWGEQQVLGSTA